MPSQILVPEMLIQRYRTIGCRQRHIHMLVLPARYTYELYIKVKKPVANPYTYIMPIVLQYE